MTALYNFQEKPLGKAFWQPESEGKHFWEIPSDGSRVCSPVSNPSSSQQNAKELEHVVLPACSVTLPQMLPCPGLFCGLVQKAEAEKSSFSQFSSTCKPRKRQGMLLRAHCQEARQPPWIWRDPGSAPVSWVAQPVRGECPE